MSIKPVNVAPPVIIERPSPNRDARPEGAAIDTLILHYTDMASAEEAIERLCDPQTKVSAHYLIGRDGRIYRMVEEGHRAWHAGVSFWRGNDGLNARSIGIELDNPGHRLGYVPFTEPQLQSLVQLGWDILSRHAIPGRNVVAHSDVAPERKMDPGELFPWARMAKEGIGVWPDLPLMDSVLLFKKGEEGAGVLSMQERLSHYGYNLAVNGTFDEQTEAVVKAFQRHFGEGGKPIDGVWDSWADEMLSGLLNMCD